jgi:hypothetical protein
MASDSTVDTPLQPSSREQNKPPTGPFLSGLGLWILEIILPVVLAAGALWFLFRNFNLWHMNRTLALVLLALGLVVISFMLGILLDMITSSKRKKYRKQGVKFADNGPTQLLKFALGGIILPLASFAAAILITLPAGGTALDVFIRTSQPPVQTRPSEQIASLVIQSHDPFTQKLGIQALAGLHSYQGLEQLVRVVNEGSELLRDAGLFQALSKALASYGVQAKGPLLDAFSKVAPSLHRQSTALNDDMFSRYFAGSFESLRNEMKNQNGDPAEQEAQIAQIHAAEARLRKTLADLGAERLKAAGGDLRQDLVLRTFLSMNLTEDTDVLRLAKTVAADAGYPASVRGDALLLVGKLGRTDDFPVLYAYLKADNRILQARALEAITALQGKTKK